jgi:Zn ribbon nucleic-acid-binding protein
MESIISNCPLCEEHSLHIIGEKRAQLQQCISCGYVSSPKYIGDKETNEEFQKLTEDMKNWAKEVNDRIWIPTMMTLPTAMLYPFDDSEGSMKWAFAPMVDIPEGDRKDYPIPGGGFYEKTYDVENPNVYETFIEAMSVINEESKKVNVDG